MSRVVYKAGCYAHPGLDKNAGPDKSAGWVRLVLLVWNAGGLLSISGKEALPPAPPVLWQEGLLV